jgi:hypothetical protein
MSSYPPRCRKPEVNQEYQKHAEIALHSCQNREEKEPRGFPTPRSLCVVRQLGCESSMLVELLWHLPGSLRASAVEAAHAVGAVLILGSIQYPHHIHTYPVQCSSGSKLVFHQAQADALYMASYMAFFVLQESRSSLLLFPSLVCDS